MRAPSASTVQWLLLSDLHFKHHDLDRVWQTAQWIVAEAERNQVQRAVTTALNALNIKRLAPYVSLHSVVAHHEWDGQRVLLLPFREEQNELTEAVAALGPNEASKTVAFAHLAINKAITQRYVVGAGVDNPRAANSITHRGLTGPNRFASLARTFTGHFHSHQTITQEQSGSNKVDL
ncbi:hypothetical protein FALCPG4_015823 [Fusarium falciforme]